MHILLSLIFFISVEMIARYKNGKLSKLNIHNIRFIIFDICVYINYLLSFLITVDNGWYEVSDFNSPHYSNRFDRNYFDKPRELKQK